MDLQPCPFCGQNFPAYQYLADHIERNHSEFITREEKDDDDDDIRSFSASPEPEQQEAHGPPLPTRPAPPAPAPAPPAPEAVPDEHLERAESSEDGSFFEYGCCPLEECEEQVPLSEMDEHIEFHQMQMALNGSQLDSTPGSHISGQHHSSAPSPNDEDYHSTHASLYAPDSSNHTRPSSALPSDAEAPSFPVEPRERSHQPPTSQSPSSGKMPHLNNPNRSRRRAPGVGDVLRRFFDPGRNQKPRRRRSPGSLRLGVS
jgi:hypothetical protein